MLDFVFWYLHQEFKTALMCACTNGHAKVVQLLLEQKGIDVDDQSKASKNPEISQLMRQKGF